MNKISLKILLSLFLLIFNSELKSQNYNDWIVLKTKDTIKCNITFINDQSIFYEYKKRYNTRSDFVSKSSIIDFYKEDLENAQLKYKLDDIIFYGYDYSHFKINDVKRIGQDINYFIFIWIDYMNKSIDPVGLASRFSIKNVSYNQDYTIELNRKLNSRNLFTAINHSISEDSIKKYIKDYPYTGIKGTGFVVIYECFSNPDKTVSAYYVFFNPETKEILQCDYFASMSNQTYDRVKHWSAAVYESMRKYSQQFKPKPILQ